MNKQVTFNNKQQEAADKEELHYSTTKEMTLNWLGVFLIVLFSILSFGIYLIPCTIQGVWILPNSGYNVRSFTNTSTPGSAYPLTETTNQELTGAIPTKIDQQQQIVLLRTVNPTVGHLQGYVQHQPLVTLNTNDTITINFDLALAALTALSTNVAIFSQYRQDVQETRILPMVNYLPLRAPDLSVKRQPLALAIKQPSRANPSVLFITREGMELMSTFLNQLYSRILHNNFSTPTHPGSHLIEGPMVQLSSRSIAQYKSPRELVQEAQELLCREASTQLAANPYNV